ncbi:MAG: ABC transporter substrate-binding protein, partial [Gammaproteobacteria bacterium]|nr:ABC transporter substrate-binding protein [Gammaproteobacteria bacterium]
RVFDVIAVTNDLIDKHPDLVTKFLDVTDQATVYLRRKPDKAKPIIAEAAGMGLKDSNIVLSLFKFPEREDQLSARWMGGGVQAFMQEAAAFFVKQGQMPKALDDYGTTVDSSFYEKVN